MLFSECKASTSGEYKSNGEMQAINIKRYELLAQSSICLD